MYVFLPDISFSSNFFQVTTKVFIKYSNLVCEGPYSLVWIFVLYGLVAITQIMAVILAFLTRNVTIKALNDSKYLSVIIYVSTVILVAMLISAVLINESINADAAVFGILIFFFTTVVLGLTFIPKVKHCVCRNVNYEIGNV